MRLLANEQEGTALPLETIPSCPGLTMSNAVFVFFLRHYQAMPELSPGPHFQCHCRGRGVQLYPAVHHELCPGARGFHIRHDYVAHTCVDLLRAAGLSVQSNFHPSGSRVSPDVQILNFPIAGQNSYVEVAVTSASQAAFVRSASQVPLYAASREEREKTTKYRDICAPRGWTLFPAVLEQSGAFGPGLKRVLGLVSGLATRDFMARSAHRRTWSSPTFRRYWAQRLAVALWNGSFLMQEDNALWRVATHPPAPLEGVEGVVNSAPVPPAHTHDAAYSASSSASSSSLPHLSLSVPPPGSSDVPRPPPSLPPPSSLLVSI